MTIRHLKGKISDSQRLGTLLFLPRAGHEEEPDVVGSDIEPGGMFIFNQVRSDVVYTIGVYADAEEGENICIIVYDGDTEQEPYEIKKLQEVHKK